MLRVLFTAVPAFGHDVTLPLLTAAEPDGHDVAFATSGSFADVLADVPLLDVGPGAAELVAEATRRDGGVLAIGPGNMTGQAGLFTDTRVDLTWSDSDGVAVGRGGSSGPPTPLYGALYSTHLAGCWV